MKRKCTVKGCSSDYLAKGFCSRHWEHMSRHGKILERTPFTPNDFIIKGNIVEVVLFTKWGDESGRAIIDTQFLDVAKKHKWYLNNSGYAITRINRRKQVLLHRMIIETDENLFVDHINGNTLDNRKSNLRICSHKQNLRNLKTRIDNTSGFPGVGFCKRKNKWRARIHVNDKDVHLGYFPSKEEAVVSRENAEKKYWSDFLPYKHLKN